MNQIITTGNNIKDNQADYTIRNKIRFSIANRHKIDKYHLPSYCF